MKLSNLIIEAAKRPEEIPAREWLVQDIELNPDSSSEILFHPVQQDLLATGSLMWPAPSPHR